LEKPNISINVHLKTFFKQKSNTKKSILIMKANRYFGILKAIAFIAAVFFLVSCCDPTLPTVKTVRALATTSSVVVATGKIVSDGNADLSSYGFCLSQNPLPTISDTKKECGYTGSYPSYDVYFYGLESGATYYIRAYAINSEGLAYGEAIEVKTGATVPSVKSSEATLITKTEATLNATVSSNGATTESWFEYWTKDEAVKKAEVGNSGMASSDVVSVKVNGLTPGKTYSFVAKSKNEYGETSGDTLNFETYAASDADGNLYHAVTIGNQVWLKENFKGTHYANGDPIPNLTDTAAWLHSTSGAYCYYNNDSKLGEVYGGLYNWYVTNDPRGLIVGWKVPSADDWVTLKRTIGMNNSGLAMMEKGTDHWVYSNGTNTSGFTALPNGGCGINVAGKFSFDDLKSIAAFWCSDSLGESSEIAQVKPSFTSMLDIGTMRFKNDGYGIRLIKN
jgi:uncharacterized protein (TIGR02145 family)